MKHDGLRGWRRLALGAAVTAMLGLAAYAGPQTLEATAAASAAQKPQGPVWQRVYLGTDTASYDFPVYANYPLDGNLGSIREVVFVQHGLQRNGNDYYIAGAELLQTSGHNPDEVLLIAPNLLSTPNEGKGFDGMPVWLVDDWIGGFNATNAPYTDLSSLEILDDLIGYVTDPVRAPNVKHATVAGHSGGGQIMQRYAVLNNVDEAIRKRGIDLRYVIANPSSYLYFTPERPRGKGLARYSTSVCPDYDHYKYGMVSMVPYVTGKTGHQLFNRYAQRHMTYLVGTHDNDPNHRVLDKLYGAEAEGPTHLDRARNYWRYERYLAGRKRVNHQAHEVVGVGREQAEMFGSCCGAQAVFGMPASANISGAACQAPHL